MRVFALSLLLSLTFSNKSNAQFDPDLAPIRQLIVTLNSYVPYPIRDELYHKMLKNYDLANRDQIFFHKIGEDHQTLGFSLKRAYDNLHFYVKDLQHHNKMKEVSLIMPIIDRVGDAVISILNKAEEYYASAYVLDALDDPYFNLFMRAAIEKNLTLIEWALDVFVARHEAFKLILHHSAK